MEKKCFRTNTMKSTTSNTTKERAMAMVPPTRPTPQTLHLSPSNDASLSSLSSHGAETTSYRAHSPSVFDPTNVADIVKMQQKKFRTGERAFSPVYAIPIDYYTSQLKEGVEYRAAWVHRQHEKAQQILFDDRFDDAINMVSDGRAELLVSHGYNMYGQKIRDGRNFFDKPLDEEYGMLDWLPKWVLDCKSQMYYEIKHHI